MKKYELEMNNQNIKSTLEENIINNEEYIKSLIALLKNINESETICIDGAWGTGKTFLIKQIEYLIKNYNNTEEIKNVKILSNIKENLISVAENNLVFYYDAWANDDHISPFESIIYNILSSYPENKNIVSKMPKSDEILSDVLEILKGILSKQIGIDLNSDCLGKIKTFDDLALEINTYEEKKQMFKKLIDKILNGKRMILIIDELDRCNPHYATKILETIKHFYDLKSITIIIVANNNELVNTIKQQYGQDFDAYTYLFKFYDYVMSIDSLRSIDYAKKKLEFSTELYLPHNVFYAMIEMYNFTLRDCNRYRVIYEASIDNIEGNFYNNFFNKKENDIIYKIIVPIILALKIKNHEAYNQCLNKQTEKLTENIAYLNNYFKNIGETTWLYDIVYSNKDDQKDEQNLIEEIIKVFLKIINNSNYNSTFMRAIKVM